MRQEKRQELTAKGKPRKYQLTYKLRKRLFELLGDQGVFALMNDLRRRVEGREHQEYTPRSIPEETIEKILEVQRQHPYWGSCRVAKSVGVSYSTILKYGKRPRRVYKLEIEDIERLYRMREQDPFLSITALARKVGIAPQTAQKYLAIKEWKITEERKETQW